MKFPNIITFIRFLLIPLIALSIYSRRPFFILLGIVLFIIATASDYLDGLIARKTRFISTFGTFFDPIVDKMMVLTMFFIFADLRLIPIWIPLILLFRELLVSFVRQACSTPAKVVGANWMGRSKFVMQAGVILYAQIFLYLDRSDILVPFFNKTAVFYASLIMVIISFIYLSNFIYWHRKELVSDI